MGVMPPRQTFYALSQQQIIQDDVESSGSSGDDIPGLASDNSDSGAPPGLVNSGASSDDESLPGLENSGSGSDADSFPGLQSACLWLAGSMPAPFYPARCMVQCNASVLLLCC